MDISDGLLDTGSAKADEEGRGTRGRRGEGGRWGGNFDWLAVIFMQTQSTHKHCDTQKETNINIVIN